MKVVYQTKTVATKRKVVKCASGSSITKIKSLLPMKRATWVYRMPVSAYFS